MHWYIAVIKHYSNFDGRARKKEYWTFTLFNCIFGTVAWLLDSIIGIRIPVSGTMAIGIISVAYWLFIFIPSLSLLFRRLHDVNKSAWWLLLSLIPVIGWIWIIVYTATDGTRGTNWFGDI